MKNYDFAALSSGFQNNLELQNIYNNGNSKGRIQQNNRQRMMSSTDIIKNKSKIFNLIPFQTEILIHLKPNMISTKDVNVILN